VLTRHYQTVRCVRFTDDGSHFVTGGDDNFVAVWALSSILLERGEVTPQGLEPRWLWSSHSLPVSDIHVTKGGVLGQVVTVSLDQTCRVWDIASGQLLSTIIFDCSLTSVLMDSSERKLFVGTAIGDICLVNLYETPVQVERHFNKDEENILVLRGHSKQVTCLGISLDGTTLASGSHDSSVKLWDVQSCQCTRTIPHKGVITNLLMVPKPKGFLNPDARPSQPLQQLQRHLHEEDNEGKRVLHAVRLQTRKRAQNSDRHIDLIDEEVVKKVKSNDKKSNDKETAHLLHVNKELYSFALDKILNVKSS